MTTKQEFKLVRVINAPLDLVWKVHTEAGHLLHWWGPKELKMVKAEVDLRPGGMFHYGMQAPDGSELWGRFIYREIVPMQKLVFVSSFSDADGGITLPPMAQGWPKEILNTATFEEQDGKTVLTITGRPINATPEEEATYHANHASMEGGFGGTYQQLADYLLSLK
jgi:uncharacterized protein YndB with AHSA1/START domain